MSKTERGAIQQHLTGTGTILHGFFWLALSLPGFLIVMLGMYIHQGRVAAPNWIAYPAFCIGCIFMFVPGFWRYYKSPGDSLVAAILLRHAICAQCGYDTSHTAPEADGCTVCPECGAAWRVTGTLPSP